MTNDQSNIDRDPSFVEYRVAKKPSAARRFFITLISAIGLWLLYGIIGSLLLTLHFKYSDPKGNATKISLYNIKQALLSFKADCGRYPTTEEGLKSLVTAPTPAPFGWHVNMDKLPRDGWGNPFQYVAPGPGQTDFDLYSTGEDEKAGTADDIHVRDLK